MNLDDPKLREVAKFAVLQTGCAIDRRQDMEQEAWLGILGAGHVFDPKLGVPFHLFARARAVFAVLGAMRKADVVSRKRRDKIKSGELPDLKEVPLLVARQAPAGGVSPEAAAIAADAVRSVLSQLEPRERYVLGEIVLNDRTHRDVAAELGITRARVSQMLTAALEKLRAPRKRRISQNSLIQLARKPQDASQRAA